MKATKQRMLMPHQGPGGTEVRELGKSAKGCRGRKLRQAEVWWRRS